MIGKIHNKDALFLRQEIGTAKTEDGNEYTMATTVPGCVPLVKSKKSGKWFQLSWKDILTLAIDSGFDVE